MREGGFMTAPLRAWLLAVPAGLLAASGGCADAQLKELRADNERLTRELERCRDDLAARNAILAQLEEQLRVARGFGPEEYPYIFAPETIEIDRLSGGMDTDGQPGDDGVTVYLTPRDRHGDPVKVAGDIRIELYDLAAQPGENRIGVYEFPHERAAELWYGRLMTSHYTLKCPWQTGPPAHPEITIRATFADYLTKRVLTAQSTCRVKLPPQSATQPAQPPDPQ